MKNIDIMTKQILGIIIFFLGLVVLFNIIKIPFPQGSQKNTAGLILNWGDGSSRKFEGPVIDGMTILEAIQSSAESGNFEVDYSYDKAGHLQLKLLAGKLNQADGKSWHFYLNKKYVNTQDIGNFVIKKYDIIEVRYE